MSQKKVDQYKKEKANRKANMQKEKRMRRLYSAGAALVAVAVIGWFGYSVYNSYEEKQPKQSVEIDYGDINAYQQGVVTE